MGCGKTTLGRAVARRVPVRFIDLDEYIEEREGMTVRQIFETRGEAAFRQLERECLAEVASMTDVLVATGGGTPCQPGLMDIMLDAGTTVWLDTSPDRLYTRLQEGRSTRPLIASLSDNELRAFIDKALADRRPHYSLAAHRFDSTRLENEEEVEATATQFIRQFIKP